MYFANDMVASSWVVEGDEEELLSIDTGKCKLAIFIKKMEKPSYLYTEN